MKAADGLTAHPSSGRLDGEDLEGGLAPLISEEKHVFEYRRRGCSGGAQQHSARADPYHSSGVNGQWMRDLAHLSAAGRRPHPPSEPEGNAPGERREPIDAWTEESSSPGAGGARLHARGSQPAADAMPLPLPIRLHRRRRAASHEARDRWLGVCPEPEWERPPAAGGREEGNPWG